MAIHQKQVSAYERGRHIPSTEVLIKLADIFDVFLDYLALKRKKNLLR
jgi:transcriptional regulator with XRE-family HTH domain